MQRASSQAYGSFSESRGGIRDGSRNHADQDSRNGPFGGRHDDRSQLNQYNRKEDEYNLEHDSRHYGSKFGTSRMFDLEGREDALAKARSIGSQSSARDNDSSRSITSNTRGLNHHSSNYQESSEGYLNSREHRDISNAFPTQLKTNFNHEIHRPAESVQSSRLKNSYGNDNGRNEAENNSQNLNDAYRHQSDTGRGSNGYHYSHHDEADVPPYSNNGRFSERNGYRGSSRYENDGEKNYVDSRYRSSEKEYYNPSSRTNFSGEQRDRGKEEHSSGEREFTNYNGRNRFGGEHGDRGSHDYNSGEKDFNNASSRNNFVSGQRGRGNGAHSSGEREFNNDNDRNRFGGGHGDRGTHDYNSGVRDFNNDNGRGRFTGGHRGRGGYDSGEREFNNDNGRGRFTGGHGGRGNGAHSSGEREFNNDNGRGRFTGGHRGRGGYDSGEREFNNDNGRGRFTGGHGGRGNGAHSSGEREFNNDNGRGRFNGGHSGRGGYNSGENCFGNELEENSYGRGRRGQDYRNRFDYEDGENSNGYSDRSGYSNSRGYPRFGDTFNDNRPFEPAENRAPRGWVPKAFEIEEIYEEDSKLSELLPEENDSDIEVLGGKDVRHSTIEETTLNDHLKDILKNKCKYKKLRPVQAAIIPQVLSGNDVLGHSETGSGKTLAYVLPILNWLLDTRLEKKAFYPYALVICPARELAVQIRSEFQKMAHGSSITVGMAFGQYDRRINLSDIANCEIIVGTLGRLVDFVEKGQLDLEKVRFLVIDEADRLMNEPKLDDILLNRNFARSKETRQTLLFSATSPDTFKAFATKMLKPNFITVQTKNNGCSKANRLIKQIYIETSTLAVKHEKLIEVINEEGSNSKMLIFVSQKNMADLLAGILEQKGISAQAMHGDRPQHLRQSIFSDFKFKGCRIIIGTDVCARGWDVGGLDVVVNFDLPSKQSSMEEAMDTFFHRIGRCGRVKEGKAISFVTTGEDNVFAPFLIKACKDVGQEPADFLLTMEQNVEVNPPDTVYEEVVGDVSSTDVHDPWNVTSSNEPSTETTNDQWANDGEWGSSSWEDSKNTETKQEITGFALKTNVFKKNQIHARSHNLKAQHDDSWGSASNIEDPGSIRMNSDNTTYNNEPIMVFDSWNTSDPWASSDTSVPLETTDNISNPLPQIQCLNLGNQGSASFAATMEKLENDGGGQF